MHPPPGTENRSRPEWFNYGSPGSPLNPNASQWAAGAGTELKPFNAKDWMVDSKKPSKELKTYDGDMINYDTWRRRVRDHFVGPSDFTTFLGLRIGAKYFVYIYIYIYIYILERAPYF